MKQTETILTITGSDSTGGSGVQADTRMIARMGGVAASAITSITMQNSLGIQQFFDLPAQVVEGQMEAVINDVEPQVVKIGMLRTVELVHVVARMLRKYRPRHVIYDPVARSSRGEELMPQEVVSAVKSELLPLCSYVVQPDGDAFHGQRNLLSSAIAVYLSRGEALADAVRHAHDYLAALPAGDRQTPMAEPSGRAGELYHAFQEAVERFYRTYNDVAFYAEQLNVSSRYLAQVTRRIAGRSPKQVIEERLTSAIEHELRFTGKPLKAIAQQYGFSSQAHLAKFFKKQRGTSPSQFRREAPQLGRHGPNELHP